ncbi:unnamed protein product, partial [Ixodes hexagonus]
AQLEQRSLKSEQETLQRKRRTTTLLVAVVASVLVSLIITLVLLLGHRAKRSRSTSLSWCTADCCLEHSAHLTQSMDTTAQPCQDFYAYVCGKWKPSADESYVSDVAGQMRSRLQRVNAIRLFNGTSKLPSFNRVSATFKSCIERGSGDQTSHVERLKVFMHARGIPWPQDPPDDVHPLDVLLDLDINWAIPVLFRTIFLKGRSNITVVIRSNRLTDAILGEEKLRGYFYEDADALLRITFGSSAIKMLPAVCYYQIEQRYGAASMLSGYITNHFLPRDKKIVSGLLKDLQEHVLAVLQRDRTEGAVEQVRSMRFRIWPSVSLESSLNRAFRDRQRTYFDFWIQTSNSLQSSLSRPLYNDIYGLPGLLDPFVDYSLLGNRLSISMNALSSPLYYRDGTRAINYGGLGWQVARTIFKSIEGMVSFPYL